MDFAAYIAELELILEKGARYPGAVYADPMLRVKEIISLLLTQVETNYQREKAETALHEFKIYFKEKRAITEDEIERERHFVMIAISNLRRAYLVT